MLYIDSGSRTPAHALATWLQQELTHEVCELRWQSGFFSEDALSIFEPVLRRLAASQGVVNVLIGSNECDTLAPHVDRLVGLLDLPRANTRLGVVCFANGYFHPKTYHIKRTDGSQAAYVGSANLTLSGIGALHVEAGIILDSRNNDSTKILDEIALAADVWFDGTRDGIELINDRADVQRLANQGVLSVARPPRAPSQAGGGNGGAGGRPRLSPLVRLPALPTVPAQQGPAQPAAVVPQAAQVLPVAPRDPYPQYVLFAPGATEPTAGVDALSGAALPGGYVGIIFRLTRDSDRHFRGGTGTSNISIPVATVSTLRFGTFERRYVRPRAEFQMNLRFLGQQVDLRAAEAETNVMVYGFAPGESGHGDVRLIIPKAPAQQIAGLVQNQHRHLPVEGDYVFMEWPTQQEPQFKISLLERGSPIAQQAANLLAAATVGHQLVGQACWLPPNMSPHW